MCVKEGIRDPCCNVLQFPGAGALGKGEGEAQISEPEKSPFLQSFNCGGLRCPC